MKHSFLKTSLAILMLTAGAAHAAGIVNDSIVTKTVDLIFQGETGISLNIVALNTNFSTTLARETPLATATIKFTGDTASQIAYRFASQVNAAQEGAMDAALLVGKTNHHVMAVKFSTPVGVDVEPSKEDDGWMVTKTALPVTGLLKFDIVTAQDGAISPDTYTATVEAGRWAA